MASRGLGSADDATKQRVSGLGGAKNTPKQQEARRQNIRKAQEARRRQGGGRGGNRGNEGNE